MKKLLLVPLILIGCDNHHYDTPTRSTTNVNVESHLMSAEDLDLSAIIAKVKDGTFKNPQDLEQFINVTPGINNIDINKDGNIDEVSVKEETINGKIAFAITAHPLNREEVVVAEVSVTRDINTGSVNITGGYPSYVHGYHEHYYNHTLTGSVVGDMMFYHYLFHPHPVYVHTYSPHYYQVPRVVVSRTTLVNVRSSTYRSYNLTPTTRMKAPTNYAPTTTFGKRNSCEAPVGLFESEREIAECPNPNCRSNLFAVDSSYVTSADQFRDQEYEYVYETYEYQPYGFYHPCDPYLDAVAFGFVCGAILI